MRKFLAMCLLLVSLLVGCSALMSHTPRTASLTLPGTPREVYPRAVQAFAQLGGKVTTANSEAGLISGEVHKAVVLTVTLQAVPDGTKVEASATLLPDKLVFGSVTEATDYIALLR